VKLVSGAYTGGVQLHASTGAGYVYGAGTFTTPLTQGQWIDLTLDLSKVTTASWDPSQVVQIGIQFSTGTGPTGGTFAGPVDAVFQIDTITDGEGTVTPVGLAYTFNNGTQGFSLNNYADTSATNLGAAGSGSTPALTFDGAEGSPSPGSLKLAVTFTAYNQYVDAIVGLAPVADLTGKILHAKVRLTPGAFTGGVQLHASTGLGYVYGAGDFTTPVMGDWTDLSLDMSAVPAASWNPSEVIQIGIQLATGAAPDGGTFGAAIDTVLHIDTITE
jgi:hypothetical protein